MVNFFTKKRGSVSVFLSMILVPMLLFSITIVDYARITASKTMVSNAADLAVNAGLTYYDATLKDLYGVFAISKSKDDLQKNLIQYFNATLEGTGLEIDRSRAGEIINGVVNQVMEKEDLSAVDLMGLQQESFTVSPLKNGTLANDRILKRQILDYMKYRGPVEIGMSFFEQLSAFANMKQQSNVMNKKLDYEKALDNYGEQCKDLYKSITEYNKKAKETAGSYQTRIKEYIDQGEKRTESIYQMEANPDTDIEELKSDPDFYNRIEANTDSAEQCRRDGEKNRLKLEAAINTLKNKNVQTGNTDSVLSYLRMYNQAAEYFNEYSARYKLCCQLETDKKNPDHKEMKRQYTEYKDAMEAARQKAEQYSSSVETDSKTAFTAARKGVKNLCDDLGEAKERLEDCQKKTKKLLKQIGKLEKKKEKWGNSVQQLDGGSRDSMETDYETVTKDLDRKQIEDLKNLLDDIMSQLSAALSAAETTYTTVGDLSHVKGEAEAFAEQHKEELTQEKIIAEARDQYKRNVRDRIPSTNYPKGEYIVTTTNSKFFSYLDGKFANELPDSEDKKEMEEKRDSLLNDNKSDNIDKTKGNLPSNNVLTPNLPSQGTGGENGTINVSVDKKGNTDTFSSDFFAQFSIGNVVGGAVEKAYLMEYGMRMFSFQTIEEEKEEENKKEVSRSLSRHEINKTNNVMYPGEAEYLVFGQNNAKKNCEYMGASIFGVRFMCNCIYALTDSEINGETMLAAVAIAGWTGFGVPLVKTVLKLGLAMAESALDLQRLLDGESVPILKNDKNWTMSLSGARNGMKKIAEKAAEKLVNEAMDKLETIAVEKLEEARGGVKNLINQASVTAVEQAQSAIEQALQNLSCDLLLERSIPDDEIKNQIDKKIKELGTSLDCTTSGGQDQIYQNAKNVLFRQVQSRSGSIADAIIQARKNASTDMKKTLEKLQKTIMQPLQASVNDLTTQAASQADRMFDSIEGEFSKKTEEARSAIKEKTKEYLDQIGSGSDYAALGIGGDSSVSSNQVASSVLAMKYSGYVRIFLYLKLLSKSGEKKVVTRIADLIQMNTNRYKENNNIGTAKPLSEMPCYLELDVTASGKTVLMNHYNGGKGSRYGVTYKTVQGY